MLKRNLFYLIVLFSSIVSAKEKRIIEGVFERIEDNTNVILVSYNYENHPIAQSFIKSKSCKLLLPDTIKDGIYKIIINPSSQNTFINTSYSFDLILDKSENLILFEFNPSSSHFPKIIESEINLNFYNYLILENYRLKDINELSLSLKKTGSDLEKDQLKNDTYDLTIAKLQFIADNFNKWSSLYVKNNIYNFELEATGKSKYWQLFDINNPELINSPIYQNLISKYITTYYKNVSIENYRKAYDEIIQAFSSDPNTKKWVLKYVAVRLKELGNSDLQQYFANKYHYK